MQLGSTCGRPVEDWGQTTVDPQPAELHACNMCVAALPGPHPGTIHHKAVRHVIHNPQHLLQLLLMYITA